MRPKKQAEKVVEFMQINRCTFWAFAAHGILCASIALAQGPKGGGGGGPPPAAVVVDTVIEKPLAVSKSFVGTLMPLKRSTVGSAVEGRMTEFMVSEGDWVEQGQPMAQLLTKTIDIEIAAAKAELALQQQLLLEMEAGLRPEEKARAKAKLEETRALMVYTKDKLTRTQRLFQMGNSASREQLDQAVSEAEAANQAFLAAQADADLAEQGNRKEKIEQSRAARDFAQEQLNLLEDRREKYTIKAPFDGYVIAEHTEVGAWVKQGDAIVEVIDIEPIEVTVSVPEGDIPGLQQSIGAFSEGRQPTPADVRIEAFQPRLFGGNVVRIVPMADMRTRTFPVKVHVENPIEGGTHLLKAGMFCHVTLPVGKPTPSLLVPKDALVLGGATPMVYIAAADPKTKQVTAQPVAVSLGLTDGTFIQVSGQGLAKGQQVVVRGNERLRPGQPLQIVGGNSGGQTARVER